MIGLKGISITDKNKKMKNVLTFYVNPSKNKFQIKKDVLELIRTMISEEKEGKVKIEGIRTINYKKKLRLGRIAKKKGLKNNKIIKIKKAFVKLSKNFNLDNDLNQNKNENEFKL